MPPFIVFHKSFALYQCDSLLDLDIALTRMVFIKGIQDCRTNVTVMSGNIIRGFDATVVTYGLNLPRSN